MKTTIIIILMLSSLTASQAQDISFNALKNGVIDDAEIKKELILNGFTKITGSSDSSEDTYAYRYNEEEETAATWVIITKLEEKEYTGKGLSLYLINIQSSIPFFLDDLKEEIVQNCSFSGVGDDDALVYIFESKTAFNISSEDGTNLIWAYPLIDTESPESEKEALEWQRQEQERIGRERQEGAAGQYNVGSYAFGDQVLGETDGSEGITEGNGNQGSISGSPYSDRYDTGGGLGHGPTFSGLGSRTAVGKLPLPNVTRCYVNQKIEITVYIQVDRDGKVISAIVSTATYEAKCIWDSVVAAAKMSRFSPDQSAGYSQSGWIKYVIAP